MRVCSWTLLGLGALLLALALALHGGLRGPRGPSSLEIALAPLGGDDPHALEIARLQERLRRPDADPRWLERLGWLFVARARSEADPGYYKLAEHAALALEARLPRDAGARLLLGHALQSQHRFAAAEALARELVAERGLPADHGLLGDALMEQGRVREAADAYQRMMDLRPDAQAYVRAAQLRWLLGSLDGALAAMEMGARAASPRDAEGYAWIWSQLAWLQVQRGAFDAAERSSAIALAAAPDLPAARVVEGRLRLAQDRPADAIAPLERAAQRSPLPSTLWPLAEALRAAGREAEARQVEQRLVETGEGADARGLALFLASRGRDPARALELARRELDARQDVFTFDALALALLAAGDARGALRSAHRAVALDTPDPHLPLHAGLAAAAAGDREQARLWLAQARARRWLLLPSERAALDRVSAAEAAQDDALGASPASGGTGR